MEVAAGVAPWLKAIVVRGFFLWMAVDVLIGLAGLLLMAR